jgi:hypothetical protein
MNYKYIDTVKILLIIALGLFISMLFNSCKKETIYPSLCNGNCDAYYTVVYENQEIIPDSNGYYNVDWNGLNYFQVKGQLTELNDQYIINGVPLVEAKFDSDYWVVFDSIYFTTPMYSYLGWFNDQGLNTPIPFGSYTYTMNDLINLHPPLNIVGYQLPKHFCTECPYAPTMIGSHSKYNYNPTQNILVDNEMIGDTFNIFIESTFNTEGGIEYHGIDEIAPKETVGNQIKVIII